MGEYEPELFVPDRSGYAHAPSHMVQTGGGNTTNNITTIERVELPGVRDAEDFIEAI